VSAISAEDTWSSGLVAVAEEVEVLIGAKIWLLVWLWLTKKAIPTSKIKLEITKPTRSARFRTILRRDL
jgi:hypothetical protein